MDFIEEILSFFGLLSQPTVVALPSKPTQAVVIKSPTVVLPPVTTPTVSAAPSVIPITTGANAYPELNLNVLKNIISSRVSAENLEIILAAINKYGPSAGIVSLEQLILFLAEVCYESEYLSVLSENLHYTAPELLATFPSYFNTTTAAEYAGQPEKIANYVYANRYGNGDVDTGDGWTYRGQGAIELTFKDNHLAFATSIGMTLPEELAFIAGYEGAIASACYYWKSHNLAQYAVSNISEVTLLVSGSTATTTQRLAIYNNIAKLFNTATV